MHAMNALRHRKRGGAAWLALSIALACLARDKARAQIARSVELRILVLSAGDVGTTAFAAGLSEALVPFTTLDLKAPARATIDEAFLVDSSQSVRRARFQAVVLPNEAPEQLRPEELGALAAFEREFKVRELDAYVSPSANTGLTLRHPKGEALVLDGLTATVESAGRAGPFAYLKGPVPFENNDDDSRESFGYLATPLADDPAAGRSFTPFVSMPAPSLPGGRGAVLGVFRDQGRERMVLTAAMNASQFQHQVLFPGMLSWLTYGVHLGTDRNYFSVHVDDVLLPNARWNSGANCTGSIDGCPVAGAEIAMDESDVDFLIAWQDRTGMKLDLVFNGAGYDNAIDQGRPHPMGDHLLKQAAAFRWISHTYTHQNLDRASPARLLAEIDRNIKFARDWLVTGQNFWPDELITGEHSGLKRTAAEADNPYLAAALIASGIRWIGSDHTREQGQRAIGAALAVPRYPMNLFHDAATEAEQVDEYNWLYTSRAHGGSGQCERSAISSCIAPLDRVGGFAGYIVPLEARRALLHVLSNSPRPHYVHQSNLSEQRILYPVVDAVLERYHATFADNAGLDNASLSEFGIALRQQATWVDAGPRIAASIAAGKLSVAVAGGELAVPLTLPRDTEARLSGIKPYAGSLTGWHTTAAVETVELPSTVPYGR
jgi:hypothetical protein